MDDEFVLKNLRFGCHYFDSNLELKTLLMSISPDTSDCHAIPLVKEVLEPLGFEPLYDDYTSEIYFQRDYHGYRIRVMVCERRIAIIDLKYLHTVVDVKCDTLNELENFLIALGVDGIDGLLTPDVINSINDFGKGYFEFLEERRASLEKLYGMVETKEDKQLNNNKL